MQKFVSLIIFSVFILQMGFAQKKDTSQQPFHVKGAVTITNKGISFIPTFTLGKPAIIFDLSMGKKMVFFEPQIRYGLNGKPWSFIFWWRYKLAATEKLKINFGAHPSVVFRTTNVVVNGKASSIIQAQRYFSTEITPNYLLSKRVSVGVYYLFSHGLDKGTVSSTHFLTLNMNFAHIGIGPQSYVQLIPQLYYLKQDRYEGYYFTSTIGLAKTNFPLSVQALFNKTIRTNIPGNQDFVWNASLIYTFNHSYAKHQ